MIRKIIQFSANNRLLVILLVAAALAYSFYTLGHIRLDVDPSDIYIFDAASGRAIRGR